MKIPNTDYSEEEYKAPVTVRYYTNTYIYPQAVSKVLELITDICNYLRNNRRIKRAAFYPKTLYDTISVLALQEYLQLIVEGGLKEELAIKAATRYIRVINNCSVRWFLRQLGKCGE